MIFIIQECLCALYEFLQINSLEVNCNYSQDNCKERRLVMLYVVLNQSVCRSRWRLILTRWTNRLRSLPHLRLILHFVWSTCLLSGVVEKDCYLIYYGEWKLSKTECKWSRNSVCISCDGYSCQNHVNKAL